MSRADRVCRTLPAWMLRTLLQLPSWRNWWTAAWLELHKRLVEDVAAETANEESGPWLVAPVRGMH